MTATAISAVVARQPTTLSGWVTGVAAHVRPWVRLNVEFSDGTGSIALRFLGRTHVPGLVVGGRMAVEGTPWMEGDGLIMLNPLYMFVDDDDRSVCKFPDNVPDEFQS
jgi:hypothetical protein